MNKKLVLTLLAVIFPSLVFAHSGKLDGSGGHRINKEWVYDGEYIEIENNLPHLEKGSLVFKTGDYHYHIKPSANKIDLTTYRDGIYLPVRTEEIKEVSTANIKISDNTVIASRNSELYHKPDCKYIKNIKEENAVIFEDKEEAERMGYIPHQFCVRGAE